MTMTKADIVEIIHQKIGFGRKESTEIVEQVFEIIQETLERGEKVKLSGFGNFVVRQKRARRGRVPKTGQQIVISARKVVTFNSGNVLRKALNQDRETLEAESNDL